MILLILCLKIFCARILDVSLGTIRMIMTIKEKSLFAALAGFCEVFIWFLIVKTALNTPETSLWIVIAYAGGYATGTFVGSKLSRKFISGNLGVQIITTKACNMVDALREKGYAVTVIDVKGKDNIDKCMLFIEINKKLFDHLQKNIKEIDKNDFIVVNETKYVQNGFINTLVK